MFSRDTERENSPEIAEALSIKTHKYLCCEHEKHRIEFWCIKKENKFNDMLCCKHGKELNFSITFKPLHDQKDLHIILLITYVNMKLKRNYI